MTNDYARKEKAIGALSYAKGKSLVVATLSGTITNIDIREGDEVSKGDTLFQILADRRNTSGLSMSQEYTLAVQSEIKTVQKLLRQLSKSLETRLADIDTRKASLKNEIAGLGAQEELARERLALLQKHVRDIKPLADDGSVSRRALEGRVDEKVSALHRGQRPISCSIATITKST